MTKQTATRATLAYILDLSETRLAQLVSSGVLPKPAARGQYDLAACVRAYLKHSRSNSRGNLAQERTRLTAAKADREEFLLKVRAKEYVARDPLNTWLFQLVRTCRDRMLSIPDRLAGILAAEADQFKVHAALHREIHQALTDLADGLQTVPDEPQKR